MTIDTKELRRLAQEATPGPWQFWHGWVATEIDKDGGVVIVERPTPSGGKYQARVDANFKFIAAANPQAILELFDRLEEAESEVFEQARLNGMGSEREAALMAKLEAAEEERDELRAAVRHEADCMEACKSEIERLRAKVAEMERQEPVKYECRRKPRNDVTWGLWKQCFKSDTARWGSKTSYEDAHFSYEVRALYALPGAKGE